MYLAREHDCLDKDVAEINRNPLVITEPPRPERPAGRFFVPPKEEFHD